MECGDIQKKEEEDNRSTKLDNIEKQRKNTYRTK